jgi:glycosyltransferase involved in cell wall biosynthesis
MQPIISLVSGTYNRIDLLRSMVQSFRDNVPLGIPYEIVLIDGGSSDNTISWAKNQADVVLIEDGALLGAISAFTRGAQAAQGKYILLANDDVQFKAGSVIPAIVHLENNMRAGAVAFKDNRPVGNYTTKDYKTLQMEGNIEGRKVGIIYAQVGLFRKWLGDKLQWWLGEHNEMQGARVYAGDNSLSAQIWNYGYTVDEVPECIVEDYVAHDELREINYRAGIESNDSHFFYDQWPMGVIVNRDPQIQQQDRRAARILYLPIYEPGWAVQKHPIHGKHGLRDALARAKNKYGATHIVQEFDYLEYATANPKGLRQKLIELADSFKPDLILTQLQSPLPITPAMLGELRQRTGATIINWNGDQAIGGLASPEVLQLLRHVDLQLITNLDVVDTYEREGVKWAYWQIGYEESADDENTATTADAYYQELGRPSPFSEGLSWPVVYLASLRSPERVAIAKIVEEFGGKVFTPGDEFASLYNFSVTKRIYTHARCIISDNGFTSRGFVSNRLFQALAAGGGVVLQQHVDGLDELTGLKDGRHYQEWTDLDNLKSWLKAFLGEHGAPAQEIAHLGTAFVREHFSFDAQVAKLMTLIKERLGESEQLANSVALRYKGRGNTAFGLGNAFPSGSRYEYTPNHLLYVNRQDLDQVMAMMPDQWEVAEGV